jgi:asparagine synthase (glutamine-hydrolysing)
MCGILVTHGVDAPFSHRTVRSLRKRGPDQLGWWTDGPLRMAATRLAILGLHDGAAGPLENDTHVLAYNGEIYNYDALRRRLADDRLKHANDAQVLLAAWSRWGEAVLGDLEGFWAFAVYDKQARTLTLVRDQFGIKPLYWWRDGGRVVAASLLRTVAEVAPIDRALDHTALSEYVRYQFTFGDRTFFRDVKRVEPGQVITVALATGDVAARRYDDLTRGADRGVPVTDAWVAEARQVLEESVLASTLSDTSFTTFCSGGVDSSLITRIARPEVAYHANYSDPDCNETFFAQQVVAGTGVRLLTVNAREEFDLVAALDDILEDFDDPTIGSVILPLDDLLAQVKRRYKVILTGTGGDELLAGYVRYQLVQGECYQDSYRALFAQLQGIADEAERFELCHTKGEVGLYRFYDDAVRGTFLDAYRAGRDGASPLEAMLRFDRRYFLAGLLNIDDKMGGRHSLESRPSLLHQRFVRKVLEADATQFLSNGDLKPVLRRIAAPHLPKPVAHRTDKMGFTTPVGTFVNRAADRIREQVLDSPFRELYDLARLDLTARTKYSREGFGLAVLDLWLNKYARA